MAPDQDNSGFMNPTNDTLEEERDESQESGRDRDDPAVSTAQVRPDGNHKEIEGLEGAGDDEPDQG